MSHELVLKKSKATETKKAETGNRELFSISNMTVIPHPPYSPDFVPCDFSVTSVEGIAILIQLR
jgi:hypothetical protein